MFVLLMALFAAGSMLHILCHQADYVYERLTGQYLVNLENGENIPKTSRKNKLKTKMRIIFTEKC